jgi:hypothetical protein
MVATLRDGLVAVLFFESKNSLRGAQTALITISMSTAKEGINPAIIPNIKHQVASIIVCPVWIEYCLADLVRNN